ncbi:MAG: tetratricopeptide repeat protein [Myxococcales bacterium]|nr:tetratricopeptide repeat protein [Myxococcales bacterium]
MARLHRSGLAALTVAITLQSHASVSFAQRSSATLAAATTAPATGATRPAPIPPPGERCIAESATQQALACPTGTMATTARPATPPPVQPIRNNPQRPTPTPSTPAIDPRWILRQRASMQSTQIARRELQLLVQLLRSMPISSPQHAPTTLRLAETLQDLATDANTNARQLDQTIFVARQRGERERTASLEQQQRALLAEARTMREQLTRVLEMFASQHASDARIDNALYTLAFTLQELGNVDRARQVYQQLLQRCPQSVYVPNAYLAFAEFYFEQADMDSAVPFYERVIAVTDPSNTLRGYAMYKLAWAEFNRRRFDASLARFYETIEYARAQQATSPSAGALLRSARQELVTAYGAVYGSARPLNSAQAFATFRRYAADEEGAVAMLEKLGELYRDNGQWPNAIAVFHELMSQRAESDRFCQWQAHVAAAYVAMNRREDITRELQRLVDVYDQYRAPSSRRVAAAQSSCRDSAARVIYDVASHWHLEALGQSADGTPQTRGTRDPRTMSRVAALYDLLLEKFSDLDQVTFPEYDQRDWPTRYRVAYYRAEILRSQGDFAACGPAFDRVVSLDPRGAFTEDAAYKAVLCYNDQLSRDGGASAAAARARIESNRSGSSSDPAPNRFATREFSSGERAMYDAFTRYACFASAALRSQPTPSANQDSEDPRASLLTIQYRRAYLAYSANQFERAATLFRAIALPSADDPARAAQDPENLREISADLYLDSLATLGRHASPARPSCFDAMESALPALRERLCSTAVRASHQAFCDRVDLLGCQLAREKAETLGRSRRFLESARATLAILRERTECRERGDLRPDEMLYNAALMFDAANRLGSSMRVREVLVERYLAGGSAWAQRALYRLGANYHAIQVFGRAADMYERYAEYVFNNRVAAVRADAQAVQQSADALRQATIFRVGLGDDDKALADARAFARYFGEDERYRRQAATVLFSLGQLYQDRARRVGDDRTLSADERRTRSRSAWNDVVRHYTSWVDRYARAGTLDQQIQGHVALGRAYSALGDESNAQRYLRAAVLAWGEASDNARTPGESRVREQLASESESVLSEALEKSRDAVAEARFGLAELVYQRFIRTRVPTFRGASTRGAFDAWTTGVLRPYVQTQVTRLRSEAEPMFSTVIRSNIPHWQIAAAARLADMYVRFASIIRESPFPPDWNRPGEPYETLRLEWRVRLDQETEPLVQQGKTGYQLCLQRATQARWFNEWSQLCERNLNEIDRAGFPLAEELRVTPSLVYSRPSNARLAWTTSDESEL